VVWDHLRRYPFFVDALLVVLVGLVSVGFAARHAHRPIGIALALLQAVPLLVRRRCPVATLAVAVAATIAVALGWGYLSPFAAAVGLYTVAAHVERRRALVTGGIAIAALAGPVARDVGFESVPFAFHMVAFAAPWILGENLRTRRAHLLALEERASRLEREREEHARRAASEEQARIARELHDVVAHSVSVMVVQAAAGDDVFDARPDRAREALRSIEQTGRTALVELRRVLGALRPDDAGLAPQPGLERLDALVERVNDAGLTIELDRQGDLTGLPASVDVSAYRIVQEALTNALKHAHASTARVIVRRTDEGVELEVADDGVGPASGMTTNGGRGLIGMRERAALLGGRFEAGAGRDGGFSVRAQLPLARAGA
jgi:signal transduction histidine kinase